MTSIATKFGLGGGGGTSLGNNFTAPWKFYPVFCPVASLEVYDSASTARDSSTTQFFTEMARRGLQDTTDWTANTYKTLLNVASGKGEVAALVGPTAGGAESTTFELTIDGVLTEIVVGALASGERGLLCAYTPQLTQRFTTITDWLKPAGEGLEADKASFTITGGLSYIMPWREIGGFGMPLLEFNTSLLIRAKHSASITNSTATAYSAVQYRLGL